MEGVEKLQLKINLGFILKKIYFSKFPRKFKFFTNSNNFFNCIYGGKFKDENFRIKHTKRGQLSMANAGPNTNGSQFFLTFLACSWLDNKHVVFGEIIEGLQYLADIENAGSDTGSTNTVVQILDCDTLILKKNFKNVIFFPIFLKINVPEARPWTKPRLLNSKE